MELVRAPRLWLAWGTGLLALALLGASWWPRPALHERRGFAEAVDFVRGHLGQGDFVLVWPPVDGASVAALPAELAASDAVPRQLTARRVFVIGAAGFARSPELDGRAAEPRQRFIDVEVASFRDDRTDDAAWDLRRELAGVRVRLGELVCDRQVRGGVRCPGRPEWNRVSAETLVVEGEAWPSVWAHPVSGQPLVLELGELELHDSAILEAALSDSAVSGPGAEVSVRLEIDGLPAAVLTRSNARGIARLEHRTPRARKAARLVITTAQDGRRHLGVNLRLVDEDR